MSKAGRPPLEPRIAALESKIAELQARIEALFTTKTPLEQYMSVRPDYKPNFDKWRPNGG
jgi:hypothetical protein